MSKFYTALILLISLPLYAQKAPEVPEYGKLLLVENRPFQPHFSGGLDVGIALDNTSEDVYSFNLMGDYAFSPLWSLGVEVTYNSAQSRPFLDKLEEEGSIKVSNFTPDWFTQGVLRFNAIKGHMNFLNKLYSPFELALLIGGGVGYNTEESKSSSLVSWGGEFLIPFKDKYRFALGVRHYKSYPFQDEELSFTSLLLGVRQTF